MKIVRKTKDGENKELLLREYFLNAYLIALMKQLGRETKSRNDRKNADLAASDPMPN